MMMMMKICTGDDGDGYQHLQRNVRHDIQPHIVA